MKVVAVIGSPHEDGPSTVLAREILRGAQDAGHEVVVYEINKMNIKGCQGCGTCKANNVDCVCPDDLQPYWKDLHEAGALILSSPNYCSQVRGDMITYMNRHYCIIGMKDGQGFVRVHPGIKLIGVFSQGNPNKDAYMDNYKWFLGDFCNRDMELQKIIVHTSADDLTPGEGQMQEAYEAGKAL